MFLMSHILFQFRYPIIRNGNRTHRSPRAYPVVRLNVMGHDSPNSNSIQAHYYGMNEDGAESSSLEVEKVTERRAYSSS